MKPWPDLALTLINVAAGRAPADMVITNGRWVNVHSGEIIPGTDVAIAASALPMSAPMPSR